MEFFESFFQIMCIQVFGRFSLFEFLILLSVIVWAFVVVRVIAKSDFGKK